MGVGAPSHRPPASSGPQAAVDPTSEESLPAGRRGRFPTKLCPRQPRRPLPAGCRFPRGRQYVETPPHSSGCPLPFRRLGLGTQGGPAFRALPGSAFLSDDSLALARHAGWGEGRRGLAQHCPPLADPRAGTRWGGPRFPATADCPAHGPPVPGEPTFLPGHFAWSWGWFCTVMTPASSSGLGTKAAGQCPKGMTDPSLGLDLQSGPLCPCITPRGSCLLLRVCGHPRPQITEP